jgi:hypothetical protein
MPPILHVVFTEFGAANLRQALSASGRDDVVISLADNLSFGPIDPADPEARRKWVEEELGFTGWPPTPEHDGHGAWKDVATKVRTFWDQSLLPRQRTIAWITRRSAMEYAGFLEWLWRLGDAPCEVVDLTEVRVLRHPSPGPTRLPVLAVSVDMLSPDQIRENNLWDLGGPLQTTERSRYRDLWQLLRTENAPLRVIDGSKTLASAPITFFDPLLLSHVKANWLKVAKVVGDALVDRTSQDVFQVGDMVLAARIDFLRKNGILEFQGKSPFAMRFSEVRLPSPRG